jgi:phosphonate transport system substrate-binding protein
MNLTRRGALAGLAALVVPRQVRALGHGGFRFGLTPVFLDNDWQLLELIRAHVREAAGRDIAFVQRRTYKEVVALLLVGEIEAAWLCGWPLLQHPDQLTQLALPVWRGAPRYQSYLIAAQDREAAGLADLRGDIHAYSDPDSNSGYLVTVSELIGMREQPEGFFSRTFFTFGHRNVVRAVARRLAQSGSVDGYVYEALAAMDPGLVARTRVVWRSEWFGFPPIAVQAAAMQAPAIRAFADALFGMDATEPGRRALRLLGLDGFAAPEPRAFDGIAARMARMADRG